MSNEYEQKAALLKAPGDNKIAVVATTTSSAELDITTRTELNGWDEGEFLAIIATTDTYVNFGDTSSGSVSETATTGATQGVLLEAKKLYRFVVRAGSTGPRQYLRHKAASAGYLRMWVSSCNPTETEM